MAGTVSFYNKSGENIHTRYIAAPPEYGKEKFLKKLENFLNQKKSTLMHLF